MGIYKSWMGVDNTNGVMVREMVEEPWAHHSQ